MEKTNTPNYNTKYLQDYKSFDLKAVKDLKRTFKPTEDEVYTLPQNNKLAFDPATKKMTSFTKAELDDNIEALEDEKVEEVLTSTNRVFINIISTFFTKTWLKLHFCFNIRWHS